MSLPRMKTSTCRLSNRIPKSTTKYAFPLHQITMMAVVFGHWQLCLAQPDPNWIEHDRDRPLPTAITPGSPSTQESVGKPPSDAVILFDGKDLSQWVSMDGSPTKW